MKINLHGGGVFYGPYGTMVSYGPNSVIDIDDDDPVSVTYWQERVDSGAAELLEAPKAAKADSKDFGTPEDDESRAAQKAKAKKAAAEEATASETPPLGGPGSGRDAWADYAASQGVEVTDDMTRDDIVAAVEATNP